MNPTIQPLSQKEFNEKYWFSPLQMVTLINPKSEDYLFLVENRHFVVRAGSKEKMPGTVANVYLSQMTRILAQDEDKMQYLSDVALMKQYYDRLIVDVESLINEVNLQPAYLSQVPETMRAEAPETPPWQQETPPSAIPETNSTMSNTVGEKKEQTKEFEFGGDKYKMVVDKNDKENFFKNGTRISAAEYSKTASML